MVDYSSEYFKLLKTCSTETEKIAEMSKELAAAYEKISFYQNQLALMHERMKNGENSVDAVDQPDYNDYNDDPVDIDNFNHAFEHSILDHGKSGNFHSASVNQSQKFEKLLHKLRCTTTLTKLTTEVIDVEEEEKLTDKGSHHHDEGSRQNHKTRRCKSCV